LTYGTVLQAVREWTPAMRFMLLQDVLRTLEPEIDRARPRRATLHEALGLLATDQPAPSDAEVARWLDEHRLQKYG
jgi:hypothetical protein